MTTTLILFAALSILLIVGLILMVIVLIKQFQKGGVLNGILGILTCGLWTFVWGWLKHKSLKLGKVMIVWTIIMVAPIALGAAFGFAMLNDMVKMAAGMTEGGSFTKIMENFEKKFRQNAPPQSASSPKKPVRVPKKGPEKMTAAKDAGWDRKALALWQDGKYADAQKALEYWSRFIGSNPQSAEAYNNRALAYCDLKRFPKAVEDYSQALRIKTDYAAAYNNRGNVYYELNRYELAEADFNRSIQLKPDYSKAYLNRGLMYYQLGKNDRACLDFKKSCDLGDCEGKQWGISKGICN